MRHQKCNNTNFALCLEESTNQMSIGFIYPLAVLYFVIDETWYSVSDLTLT